MKESTPQVVYLKDYEVPSHFISTVDLHFDLYEGYTLVRNKMKVSANPDAQSHSVLTLDGEAITLTSLKLDGKELSSDFYKVEDSKLKISQVPGKFELEIETRIDPAQNKTLEGLYKSRGIFCTQNEAEGFRRITYFLDRSDVMSIYTTTIVAEKAKYPVLLSNGNLIRSENLPNGRHSATWHDPHKKPCYLFALVAGKLSRIDDQFVTRSGRKVALQIFVEAGNEDRCGHAMESLKKSMKWDEEVFGREYDLDIYMIVAVDDFNAGAMENKGLNVFNSNYILAKPETATDRDFEVIQAVIGHEYFHNWTGNRVTLRDWFQLSLKEGLTVFREQEFAADTISRAVQRIDDVTQIRTVQFEEDAGPMAHPIRPSSYIQINNFYTSTVYDKGSEVIRMIHTLIGAKNFRKGMDRYFDLHDGKAVTTEEFVAAMEQGSGKDLTQFRRWYEQAGTPELKIETRYDERSRIYELKVQQSAPTIQGLVPKPFHIPLSFGLLDAKGKDLPLELEGESVPKVEETKILELKKESEVFRFRNIPKKPTASLLRGFSAPVRVVSNQTDEERIFLLAHDSDLFNRWDAAFELSVRLQLKLIGDVQQKKSLTVNAEWLSAMGKVLDNPDLEPAFVARVFELPQETYLSQMMKVMDVEAIHSAREFLLTGLASAHEKKLREIYDRLQMEMTRQPYRIHEEDFGKRALKNRCLWYLTKLSNPLYEKLAEKQFRDSTNMTDTVAAMTALSDKMGKARDEVFDEFYKKWKHDSVVMNKWFMIQAMAATENTFERVKRLAKDPAFDKNNPNKLYALFRSFGANNLVCFHEASGKVYEYYADQVLDVDSRNPMVAARLMGAFNALRRLDPNRKVLMKDQLHRIVKRPGVSSNVYEIASRGLQDA